MSASVVHMIAGANFACGGFPPIGENVHVEINMVGMKYIRLVTCEACRAAAPVEVPAKDGDA